MNCSLKPNEAINTHQQTKPLKRMGSPEIFQKQQENNKGQKQDNPRNRNASTLN